MTLNLSKSGLNQSSIRNNRKERVKLEKKTNPTKERMRREKMQI